jgi:hypothetical protein
VKLVSLCDIHRFEARLVVVALLGSHCWYSQGVPQSSRPQTQNVLDVGCGKRMCGQSSYTKSMGFSQI